VTAVGRLERLAGGFLAIRQGVWYTPAHAAAGGEELVLVVDEALLSDLRSWTALLDELIDLESDGRWCARAEGDLRITAGYEQVQVTGAVNALVPRACDRCLGHYLETVTLDLAEVCVIRDDAGEVAWFDNDAEAWCVGPEGVLSISELVRQALLLALPTRAVCGESCPGLPSDGSAPESETSFDPRWAVLGKLLTEESEHGRPEAEDE